MPNSPALTCSVVDVNATTTAITGNSSILIRYHSSAKATMYAKASGDASINMDMCLIRNGDQTCNEAAHTSIYDGGTKTEHTFLSVFSDTFTFCAEDSNGNVAQKTLKPQFIEYTRLTCNAANIRPDANGDMKLYCSGDSYNGFLGKTENVVTVRYRYKESGGTWNSAFQYMSVTTIGTSYIAEATISGLDYKKYYDFQFIANDHLEEVIAESNRVTSLPVFHWGKNDVAFEVPVNVKGDLRLKGDGNYGNKLYFGDGDYCCIEEPSDDLMRIKANTLDLSVGEITMGGKTVAFAEYSGWTPYLSVSSTTSEVAGWYSKSGKVVTVGFRIKATVSDDYRSSDVRIFGLPYTPAVAAAGGGMCSGAYILNNNNFQCFVAETEGYISTRVQSCDYTAGTSLSTSASGCKYPIGELTLSGTITYFTA